MKELSLRCSRSHLSWRNVGTGDTHCYQLLRTLVDLNDGNCNLVNLVNLVLQLKERSPDCFRQLDIARVGNLSWYTGIHER